MAWLSQVLCGATVALQHHQETGLKTADASASGTTPVMCCGVVNFARPLILYAGEKGTFKTNILSLLKRFSLLWRCKSEFVDILLCPCVFIAYSSSVCADCVTMCLNCCRTAVSSLQPLLPTSPSPKEQTLQVGCMVAVICPLAPDS